MKVQPVIAQDNAVNPNTAQEGKDTLVHPQAAVGAQPTSLVWRTGETSELGQRTTRI